MRRLTWLCGGLLLSAAGYAQPCKDRLKTADPATGRTTYYAEAAGAPVREGRHNTLGVVSLIKVSSPTDTLYSVLLSLFVAQPPQPRRGLTITFSDGTRLEKPGQYVGVSYDRRFIIADVELKLSRDEYSLLCRKTVTKVQISSVAGRVDPRLAKSIKAVSACLLSTW